MSTLVIDNYDSFTYNLVQMVREISRQEVRVARNDRISIEEARAYDRIILSPGPGIPSEAGIMPALVAALGPEKRILGICLGHQCVGEVYGGILRNLESPIHGKAREVCVTDSEEALFKGLPSSFSVGRYHSWVVDENMLPKALRITAIDSDGLVMAIRHVEYDVCGVQFHPESILTPLGPEIMAHWLGGMHGV